MMGRRGCSAEATATGERSKRRRSIKRRSAAMI